MTDYDTTDIPGGYGAPALARLSRREFEIGLDAVRRYANAGDGGRVIEPIDLFVFRPV